MAMGKSLEDLKNDKLAAETQVKQLNQQIIMFAGIINYLSQEIAKLEKVKEDDNGSNSGES